MPVAGSMALNSMLMTATLAMVTDGFRPPEIPRYQGRDLAQITSKTAAIESDQDFRSKPIRSLTRRLGRQPRPSPLDGGCPTADPMRRMLSGLPLLHGACTSAAAQGYCSATACPHKRKRYFVATWGARRPPSSGGMDRDPPATSSETLARRCDTMAPREKSCERCSRSLRWGLRYGDRLRIALRADVRAGHYGTGVQAGTCEARHVAPAKCVDGHRAGH